jgi:predicted nucleic acid-binding protein
MSYWDTSALVKLYALEPDSSVFETHVCTVGGPVIISRLGLHEALATFYRKESAGVLRPGSAAKLYSCLLQDVGEGELQLVELGADLEAEYARVLASCYGRTPPVLLRTLDAIHLASARLAGQTELVATDRRLRDAARALGFSLFPV